MGTNYTHFPEKGNMFSSKTENFSRKKIQQHPFHASGLDPAPFSIHIGTKTLHLSSSPRQSLPASRTVFSFPFPSRFHPGKGDTEKRDSRPLKQGVKTRRFPAFSFPPRRTENPSGRERNPAEFSSRREKMAESRKWRKSNPEKQSGIRDSRPSG